MHLLKISIDTKAYARRSEVMEQLPAMDLCAQDKVSSIVPAVRSKTDACRAAANYTLLRYQRFYDHQGRLCKAIAKSPKNAKKKGMDVQIHVQACGDETVEYTQLVAQLYAPMASAMPELQRKDAASEYEQLCADLYVPELIEQGQARLYHGDIRKICERLLDAYTVGVWTGLSLVLDDAGLAYIARVQRFWQYHLSAGTVTLSTLALDMSHANRQALARELAEDFTEQLSDIIERCTYTAPNVNKVMAAYETIACKIAQAATLLAIDIPCSDVQLQAETALMSLA